MRDPPPHLPPRVPGPPTLPQQGETEGMSIWTANVYYTSLQQYVLAVRSRFKQYNAMLPIVLGVMSTKVSKVEGVS